MLFPRTFNKPFENYLSGYLTGCLKIYFLGYLTCTLNVTSLHCINFQPPCVLFYLSVDLVNNVMCNLFHTFSILISLRHILSCLKSGKYTSNRDACFARVAISISKAMMAPSVLSNIVYTVGHSNLYCI